MLLEVSLVNKEAAMAKEARTMAMRVLDARKIHYLVHRFSETTRDAEQVAAEIGMPSLLCAPELVGRLAFCPSRGTALSTTALTPLGLSPVQNALA